MIATAEVSPRWLLASEAFPEAELEAHQRMASFLGSIAVRGEQSVSFTPEVDNYATLLCATQGAALGDQKSRDTIRTNVATDIAERMYKVAHQTKINMDFAGGKLGQNGRKLTDVHRNTLTHMVLTPEMLRRTTQELKNAVLFEQLYEAGVLEHYNVGVFSPTPTAMTTRQKQDYNFFLDTESCSLQFLSVDGKDATMETAMVAGKATPQSQRHDIATITKLMEKYGIDVNEQDGTSMLQYVLLIPKEDTPNGVVDIVRQYDEAAGGTFYGQARPREDYITYAEECEQRNRNFDSIVETITAQLISEAHMFASPIEAVERLDYLSERLGVKYAVQNKSIDEAVFGRTAALHIQEARFFRDQGEEEREEDSLRKAQSTAQSGSCPIFTGSSPENSDSDDEVSSESSGKKVMSCPYCNAKVFDDPCAKVLSCWDCKALVVNGHVSSKGNGGSRARAEKQKAEAKMREAEIAKQVDKVYEEANVTSFDKARNSQEAVVTQAAEIPREPANAR